jgi:hypothetical protein
VMVLGGVIIAERVAPMTTRPDAAPETQPKKTSATR